MGIRDYEPVQHYDISLQVKTLRSFQEFACQTHDFVFLLVAKDFHPIAFYTQNNTKHINSVGHLSISNFIKET